MTETSEEIAPEKEALATGSDTKAAKAEKKNSSDTTKEIPKLTEQERKKLEEEEEVERALEAVEEDELTLQPDTGNNCRAWNTFSISTNFVGCKLWTVFLPDEFAEEEKLVVTGKELKQSPWAQKAKPKIVTTQVLHFLSK